MPNINQLRLGAGWTTAYDTNGSGGGVAGGLLATMTATSLDFALGTVGTGSIFSQEADVRNGDDYQAFLLGTAGLWDFTNGELVWHNAAFPDLSAVEGGAASGGHVIFGVVLYNIENTDVGNWQIVWQVVKLDGVDPYVQVYLINETGQYPLIDSAITGGGTDHESFGGTTGPTHIPTPIEMFNWVRLRSAGGLIFYETSRDGTTWAYVQGSAGSAPDLGGNSVPMSGLMLGALRTVGVQFYLRRTPGYASGNWTVDNLNTAPYPTSAGDPTSETIWVSYGFDPAGQTGRGEFGPTGTYLGLDEPRPAPVLFPADHDVEVLAVGSNQSAAVLDDGHIYVWGDCLVAPDQGFFGDALVPPFGPPFDSANGDPFSAARALAVPTLLEYDDAVAAHLAMGVSALFWVKPDNTLWGVGLNANGEFGTGSSGEYFGAPHHIDIGVGVIGAQACLGYPGLFAIGADGKAYFAGDDHNAMSGSGVAGTHQLTFAVVPLVTDIDYISANGITALAIAHGGTVWIWGHDMSRTGSPLTAPVPLGETIVITSGSGSYTTHSEAFASASYPNPTGTVRFFGSPTDTSLTMTTAQVLSPPLPDAPTDQWAGPAPLGTWQFDRLWSG
jgi:hypothetical protein